MLMSRPLFCQAWLVCDTQKQSTIGEPLKPPVTELSSPTSQTGQVCKFGSDTSHLSRGILAWTQVMTAHSGVGHTFVMFPPQGLGISLLMYANPMSRGSLSQGFQRQGDTQILRILENNDRKMIQQRWVKLEINVNRSEWQKCVCVYASQEVKRDAHNVGRSPDYQR